MPGGDRLFSKLTAQVGGTHPSSEEYRGSPESVSALRVHLRVVQEYLAHKKAPPPRTLHPAFAQGPMVVLGG